MSIKKKFDSAANDSDKSWTVPTGKKWRVLWAHVILATTATVGNRKLEISVTDVDSNEVLDLHTGINHAASLTYHYLFLQGNYREAAVSAADNSIQVAMPIDLYVLGGEAIRFFDSAAIDAAADDMTVSFQVEETSI